MTLPFSQADRPIRRHDLIFVSPAGWRALLAARADLAAEPLLARWVENGWPMIGRRPMAGEASGVPAGLPLPPFAGKRRLSFLLPPADIVATAPPPVLDDVMPMAPAAWRHALGEVEAMASRHAPWGPGLRQPGVAGPHGIGLSDRAAPISTCCWSFVAIRIFTPWPRIWPRSRSAPRCDWTAS